MRILSEMRWWLFVWLFFGSVECKTYKSDLVYLNDSRFRSESRMNIHLRKVKMISKEMPDVESMNMTEGRS